jgi:hypothetical protein
MGNIPSAPGSSDVVVPGNEEFRLPGFPCAPSAHRLGQVAGGAELACSQIMTACRLLQETLAIVGRDVL